jgi:hypothetical protein
MKPFATANKLALFILARTPERRRSIVRTLKRSQESDYPLYYSSLREPARRFVANGAHDTGELTALIDRMANRGGSRWLETDSRITTEAVHALIGSTPLIRSQSLRFYPPVVRSKAIWSHPHLDVSVTPDLLATAQTQVISSGALRLYIAKDTAYELGPRGAELVAIMLHLWHQSVHSNNSVAEHCFVLECFQQRLTAAPAHPGPLIQAIYRGCEDFVRLWHDIETEEAA